MTKQNYQKPKYRQIDKESAFIDKTEMEKLIYFLDVDEIATLLLRHLGYSSDEIWRILGLNNLTAYRKLSRGLNIRIYLFKNLYQDTKDEKVL